MKSELRRRIEELVDKLRKLENPITRNGDERSSIHGEAYADCRRNLQKILDETDVEPIAAELAEQKKLVVHVWLEAGTYYRRCKNCGRRRIRDLDKEDCKGVRGDHIADPSPPNKGT